MNMADFLPEIVAVDTLDNKQFDALILVGEKEHVGLEGTPYATAVSDFLKIDRSGDIKLIPCSASPGGRIIYAPTGPLNSDFDDVRNFQVVVGNSVKKALSAGANAPIIVLPQSKRFPNSQRASLLSALHALYTPLEVREFKGNLQYQKVQRLGVYSASSINLTNLIEEVKALESGRIIARDIGGSDPERMSAPNVVKYVEQIFENTCIKVSVENNPITFEKQYPLLAAVNRCAGKVARHAGQLIHLEYIGEGPIEKTLMIVGKGINYDTGGADIKAGGVMAGMHRDKCGAAAVAGFFKMLSVYKPKHLKVLGAMAMVRNSVGSECYVADEIILSRAGVRVRVGNTDAEGRMVMTDVLCEMKEKAINEKNPFLFTFATLTGHVIRCYGENYTSLIDNGPARKGKVSEQISVAGENIGEPCDVTRLRKEDFEFNHPPTEYEDVVQANNKPSTMTNRGHMYPAAFMITASGLDKHGCSSANPLPYTHMDIAGSSGPYPGIPTGAPVLAMAEAFVFNK